MPDVSDRLTIIPNAENPEMPTIVVRGTDLALIPKSLYDNNLERQYLDLQATTDNAELIFSNDLEEYVALFKCNFAEIAQIEHYKTAKMEHILVHCHHIVHQKMDKSRTENLLFATFCDDVLHFWIEKAGKLQLVGKSPFSTEYDILYYLMNLAKQYALDLHSLQLLVYDEKKANDGALRLLKTYFSHVDTLDNYL